MKVIETKYSKEAYVADEIRRANQALSYVEFSPLGDRQAARIDWLDAIRNHPDLVAERVGWLINGSYGYGQCLLAYQSAFCRGNKVARIAQLIAAFEWNCPSGFARDAWNQLTKSEQKRVNGLIARELDGAQWAVSEIAGGVR